VIQGEAVKGKLWKAEPREGKTRQEKEKPVEAGGEELDADVTVTWRREELADQKPKGAKNQCLTGSGTCSHTRARVL